MFPSIETASSDSRRRIIFAIESIDNNFNTSVWIDSFNSIKISGAMESFYFN
jgi:hypothetical protein